MDVSNSPALPLPISWEECRQRGWPDLDVLLVTGDSYIDHPAFGVAVVGRVLERQGYRVAILAQPRYDSTEDFARFPAPRLFCGITAGNLDSIVANYTGNGRVRDSDAYSPDGNPYRGEIREKSERRRPDRACLIYANLARAAFGPTPIVLGGIEASLRRFVHYDYQQDKLRASFLTDAKADLLVYGMGERAVVELARRCAAGEPLDGIGGTCQRYTDRELLARFPELATPTGENFLILPSWEEIGQHRERFLAAEMALDRHLRAASAQIVVQRQQHHWVVQHPPAQPLDQAELDSLYHLPYTRRPHPVGQEIPAYRMIRDSVTIVRGCSGNCSFCAITRHQGPAIVSRSVDSIVRECRLLSRQKDFTGVISDLGGPTANLFGTSCTIGSCAKRDCLYPNPCPNLQLDEDIFCDLLDRVHRIEGINRVYISSGLRMALLLRTPRLLERLLQHHTPGSLKIAPEHTADELLRLMHKEPHSLLRDFVGECRRIGRKIGKKIELTPYVITAHPGSLPHHAVKLARDLHHLGLTVRKPQDFTPTPGTLSTAMYVTGMAPGSTKPLPVARGQKSRLQQRRILEAAHLKKGSPPNRPRSLKKK